jgi:glyoxylase-like metal-dependent hydrolase (beta-lactamase superfamily II)
MKVLTFCLGALRTNTYFCFDETGACVVIDPGMDGEGILEKLRMKGLTPSHIFLTHGHFDHSQGVKYLKEQTGAKVCIHHEDALMLQNPAYNSSNFYYRGDTAFYPRVSADLLLEDQDLLQVGTMSFSVLHTPGHTPGSVCFSSEDKLFCGDTVFAYGYGRYDLWGGDREALSRSLERVAALPGEFKLCPGHGNTATLSRIRENILLFSNELK